MTLARCRRGSWWMTISVDPLPYRARRLVSQLMQRDAEPGVMTSTRILPRSIRRGAMIAYDVEDNFFAPRLRDSYLSFAVNDSSSASVCQRCCALTELRADCAVTNAGLSGFIPVAPNCRAAQPPPPFFRPEAPVARGSRAPPSHRRPRPPPPPPPYCLLAIDVARAGSSTSARQTNPSRPWTAPLTVAITLLHRRMRIYVVDAAGRRGIRDLSVVDGLFDRGD